METGHEAVGLVERRSHELFGDVGHTGSIRKPVRRLPVSLDLIEHARVQLLAAGQGSRRAAARLEGLRPSLAAAAGAGNACACEIVSAMCAGGLGARRSIGEAREWIVRAVQLLEDHVERPIAGKHGFMLLPNDDAETAYRPLYTAIGVLVTNEIGTARTVDGAVCFDRWGRPILSESFEMGRGPTHTTPRSVAARIARESTLEDFAWACRRTTPEFWHLLIDARVIAHGRLGFQRCRNGATLSVAHRDMRVAHS